MHVYFISRGVKQNVEQFIKELQGKYLQFKVRVKDSKVDNSGELQNYWHPTAVHPIQLWEVVFPEEHKDVMLTTIFQKNAGKPQHKKHSKFIWAIRRMLGVEPIPEYKTELEMPIFRDGVEINAIGIKKDYYVMPDGTHNFNPTDEEKKVSWEGL